MASSTKLVIPKSLAAAADLFHKVKEERLLLDKQAAAKKAEETAIKDHLISKLQGETTGVAGKLCRVQAVTKLVPLASDWAAFWKAFNPKTDSDLVQKRVSVAAVQARWDAGEKVPGVDAVQIVDLSVSKL